MVVYGQNYVSYRIDIYFLLYLGCMYLELYQESILLKILNRRLLVKFVDEKIVLSTMNGNIHFSSYEYFKKLEEGTNDKGKSDKNENAGFEIDKPKDHIIFYRILNKDEPSLGANNLKGAKLLPYKRATWRTSYPDEDRMYGISCFTVIDPYKDSKNGEVKSSFVNDISEISNNRHLLLFPEDDLIKAIEDFVTESKENDMAYSITYGDVEYLKSNVGKRNGLQKDPSYAKQHEWRIKANMDILNDKGNMVLPALDIGLVRDIRDIKFVKIK